MECAKKPSNSHLSGYTLGCRCADCVAAAREYQYEHRDRSRELRRIKKYGVSAKDYDTLLAKQGGGCAICGATNPGHKTHGTFSVDHDHSSGEVRGLLCHTCNILIGMAHDDIDILEAAKRYLS